MDQHFYSADLDGDRKLCLAPLTDEQIENSEYEIADCGGYFLFERDSTNRVEVMAKIISEEAVQRICAAFNLK